MGIVNDIEGIFTDLRRWYYKFGVNKVTNNIKNNYRQRKLNKKPYERNSYEKLCWWLKEELKK